MACSIENENLSSDNLLQLWKKQQELLEKQKLINRDLLIDSLTAKSSPLAPRPVAVMALLSVMFVLTLAITIIRYPSYWPVPLLCFIALPDVWWQKYMRDKISSMEGGVSGMQRNLIKYKRGFRNLSIVMWILMVPYFIWFAYFTNRVLELDTVSVAMIVGLTIVGCVFIFCLRIRSVNRSLRNLKEIGEKIDSLEK